MKLRHSDVVIRRENSLQILSDQLLTKRGKPRFSDPADQRVVYTSTLVDAAGNMELLRETASACLLIFTHTNWRVRILSKSPLLKRIVDLIPVEYHQRLILGFSTGTLDDRVAKAIEVGTGLVSKRIEALHWLQDNGIPTFGMICPSLPQDDYDAFSREICDAIRVDHCTEVWAEVINVRGESFVKTLAALSTAGLDREAELLSAVCGPKSAARWETYARETFLAHTVHIPPEKYRFLQYVKRKTVDWWRTQVPAGAVLLGKPAHH
jgi:DNA repair photolyase